MKIRFIVNVGLVVLLASCAHGPTAKPTGLTAKAFWAEQARRIHEVSFVSAKLLLEYQGIKENVSGQARVVAQLPQHFRLELRDPLGRVQYVVTLADKTFTAYYPTRKKAYLDETSGRSYLRNRIGADLSFSELQGIALGVLPKSLSGVDFESWEWDGSRGLYVGKIESSPEAKDKTVTVFIDPDRAVLKELWVDSAKMGMTKISFSEFSLCCSGAGSLGGKNVFLAHSIGLTQEKSKSTLDIDWREVEALRRPRPDSLFHEDLPDDVERMRD